MVSGTGYVQSPACVQLYNSLALPALDKAAPVEFAAAAFSQLYLSRVEATATAQQLTTIDGLGCLVACAAPCAQHATAYVLLTEIWARLQVHQVLVCMWLELRIAWYQCPGGAHTARLYLSSTVEFLFQCVAHLAEGWHSSPARLYLTGA